MRKGMEPEQLMITMTAAAWIGIMFLIAVALRAKVKFLGRMLVPACMIAGIIGFILMNTTGLGDTTSEEYSTIAGMLYNVLFINLGLTLGEKKAGDKKNKKVPFRERKSNSMFSGIVGMGSFWAIAYSLQALIGFAVLYLIGGFWNMDAGYGLLIPFGFAQGPGQAVTYGTVIEGEGMTDAVQVAMLFAALGFIIAFAIGVPFARKGIEKGMVCSKVRMGDELVSGFIQPKKQENYGKVTTYGGNLDVMTLHLALIGLCWILGLQIGKLWAFIPGYFGNLFSQLLFFNGMLAAYAVKYIMGRLGFQKYMDRGTQVRISNSCTDFMVTATFMAISLKVVGKWIAPVVIACIVVAAVTWTLIRYFGARFGGENDFERVLGEWGTVTGTNATGLSLVRIADPDNHTTTAAELGPANIVNVPASYVVAPAICAFAAGNMKTGVMVMSLLGVVAAYLLFMRVTGVWGKKTFDMKTGEKYTVAADSVQPATEI